MTTLSPGAAVESAAADTSSARQVRWTFDPPRIELSAGFCALVDLPEVARESSAAELAELVAIDDRVLVSDAVVAARVTGRGQAVEHQLTVRHKRRTVIVRLCAETDRTGQVTAVVGDYFDLSGTSRSGRNPWEEQIAGLEVALASRDLIGVAKGILMASRKVTNQQAFDLLVRASQREHIPVRSIAELVAETGALPE